MDNLLAYLTLGLKLQPSNSEILVSCIPATSRIKLLWKDCKPVCELLMTQRGYTFGDRGNLKGVWFHPSETSLETYIVPLTYGFYIHNRKTSFGWLELSLHEERGIDYSFKLTSFFDTQSWIFNQLPDLIGMFDKSLDAFGVACQVGNLLEINGYEESSLSWGKGLSSICLVLPHFHREREEYSFSVNDEFYFHCPGVYTNAKTGIKYESQQEWLEAIETTLLCREDRKTNHIHKKMEKDFATNGIAIMRWDFGSDFDESEEEVQRGKVWRGKVWRGKSWRGKSWRGAVWKGRIWKRQKNWNLFRRF